MRWDHPARGPISPALFIPIAEEAGLVGAAGRMGACARPARMRRAGRSRSGSRSTSRRSSSQSETAARDRHVRSGGLGPGARPAGAGNHRRRVPRRIAFDRRDVREPEGDRGPARPRRFRNRLFLARLSAHGAVRQDQDRPDLRSRRDPARIAQRRDHRRHRRAGRSARHGDDRRGHRIYGPAPSDPKPPGQPCPGLGLQQGAQLRGAGPAAGSGRLGHRAVGSRPGSEAAGRRCTARSGSSTAIATGRRSCATFRNPARSSRE